MKKGFSLVEMLVVIGIIAVLTGASVAAFSKFRATAERTRVQELVHNTATALTALFQEEGVWPRRLLKNGVKGGELDADAGYALAKDGYLSLSYDAGSKRLTGADRFGVVSPWAAAVIRRSGTQATLATVVSTSSDGPKTVKDHLLHFAVDQDGDGIIRVDVGGETVGVRASAIVWCGGKDGFIEPYTRGLRKDDVYSWTPGMTRGVD